MKRFGLGFCGVLTAISAPVLVPGPARAADGCAMIGMFDARARALCEASRRQSQKPKPVTQNATPDDRPQAPRDNDNGVALAAPIAPARGYHRYEMVKGALFLDLAGNYPQGYGPAWKLNATTPQAIVLDRYNALNGGPQGTETMFVRIVEYQGRAVLEFTRRGTMGCRADIVGLPQVITGAPKRFQLTNFRYLNEQPQCQRKLGPNSPWQGSLTLSADADGNVQLSLALDLAMPTGAPWFQFTTREVPFANQMTPQMAAADLDRKKQIEVANATREREAATARAAAEAEARRQAAILAAKPNASPTLARALGAAVRQDSGAWQMNHYDDGSMTGVKLLQSGAKSRIRGNYTFNGGSQGWVEADVSGGKIQCLSYWDVGSCEAVRSSAIQSAGRSGSNNANPGTCVDANTTSDKHYTGQMTTFGPSYETVWTNTVTNNCAYTVIVRITGGGFLRSTNDITLSPGQVYSDTDAHVDSIRRAPR